MNIVLLSGGSGQRLWPLSNEIRSKQFIKIFHRQDGMLESMVQRVYRQIRTVDPGAEITVATSRSQVSALHNQLGENIGISVEPCRKEAIVVCPVDPYVEVDYFRALEELGNYAAQSEANLVLMGIEPTYPSEKYGYIIPEEADQVSKVSVFKEKPDQRTAEKYRWFYIDTPKGRFYQCSGQPAHPFMYPALKDNEEQLWKDMKADFYGGFKKTI